MVTSCNDSVLIQIVTLQIVKGLLRENVFSKKSNCIFLLHFVCARECLFILLILFFVLCVQISMPEV